MHGINIYFLANKWICSLSEFMSEDTVFVVNVEHHLIAFQTDEKGFRNTFRFFFNLWRVEKDEIYS